jgi:hypothetical protein
MESYLIYNRDGEEVEVGWFGLMLYRLSRLRGFWDTVKKTDWKHYFKGNGQGEVVWKHFTGFRELHNQLAYNAQWYITVKGGIRPSMGDSYYRSITEYEYEIDVCVEKNWSEIVKARIAEAELAIDLYVKPDCTCRIGFHRRCPHHFNTRD